MSDYDGDGAFADDGGYEYVPPCAAWLRRRQHRVGASSLSSSKRPSRGSG